MKHIERILCLGILTGIWIGLRFFIGVNDRLTWLVDTGFAVCVVYTLMYNPPRARRGNTISGIHTSGDLIITFEND